LPPILFLVLRHGPQILVQQLVLHVERFVPLVRCWQTLSVAPPHAPQTLFDWPTRPIFAPRPIDVRGKRREGPQCQRGTRFPVERWGNRGSAILWPRPEARGEKKIMRMW
jgi:hypothetical protein